MAIGKRSLPQRSQEDERDWSVSDPHPAPQATVEALAFQLRGGVSALREPSALRRTAALDEKQMREIAARLATRRWNKSGTAKTPPWKPDEIEAFIRIWNTVNG